MDRTLKTEDLPEISLSEISLSEIKKVFGCEYCEEEFESISIINDHKKICSSKPISDFECGFCNVCFSTKDILKKHVNKCTERPSYNCYGCSAIFYNKSNLLYHQSICKTALVKCNWITKNNRKCTFTGKYDGFCKKHYIDYKYFDPEGLEDDNNSTEVCGSITKIKYIPTSINHMVNGDFYSLEYLYNKSLYTIKEYNVTNILMENIDTKAIVTFWKDKETRKSKIGKLLNQLSAEYDFECENNAIILFNDERMLCKKCFETQYNTSISSLIVREKED